MGSIKSRISRVEKTLDAIKPERKVVLLSYFQGEPRPIPPPDATEAIIVEMQVVTALPVPDLVV
jgi:hypothetical protein